MLHGLEGSVRSNYILGLNRAFARLGWGAATLEFRSCGGEMNRASRLYHSGETTDLEFVVETLIRRRPDARLYIADFSLGGNVALKWLGERGDAVPSNVIAAAAVSPPFDMARSAPYFERTLCGLYSKRFLRTLIPKALEKASQYPGVLDTNKIRRSRTFTEFDTHATAALHGFRDAQDYWAQVSCGQFLPAIRRPTLLIAAQDDPFNPAVTIPHRAADESPYLFPLFPKTGGHVGFIYGKSPWQTHHWAEEQIVRFFQLIESAPPGMKSPIPRIL